MLRFLGAVVLSCFAVSAVHAGSPRFCRTKFAPDEKFETRFMGMGYALMIHALAEKYCGAKPVPMGPKFLGYLETQGCDSKTEIYQDVAASIAQLEGAGLKLLAADGDPDRPISEEQAQSWAKHATEELGGCELLIKMHNSKPESWQ